MVRQRRVDWSSRAICFGSFILFFSDSGRRVDPNRFWNPCWAGNAFDKPLRIQLPGFLQRLFSSVDNLGGQAVVQRTGRQQANPAMVVLVVVPLEKSSAERVGVLIASETLGKVRTVFHRFVLALGKWIVIGNVRTAM